VQPNAVFFISCFCALYIITLRNKCDLGIFTSVHSTSIDGHFCYLNFMDSLNLHIYLWCEHVSWDFIKSGFIVVESFVNLTRTHVYWSHIDVFHISWLKPSAILLPVFAAKSAIFILHSFAVHFFTYYICLPCCSGAFSLWYLRC